MDSDMELHGTYESQPTPAGQPRKKRGAFWDTVRFIVISLAIVIAFRYFIAQPFVVSGDSMVPTFKNGEYLIVDELSYRFEKPQRGDVIILRYPLDPKEFFIKRIIGLPGEVLTFHGQTITVTTADGTDITLDEPYIGSVSDDNLTVALQPDEYYVLGDNRAESSDSRRWGALPASDIVGRPLIRLLPVTRISWLPGADNPGAGTTTQP